MSATKQALVVDDTEANRMLAARLLGKAGWQVHSVEDGAQALAWLRLHCAALVLLDISMPGLSGEEVCREVRCSGICGPAKLVAYTAHAMPEEKAQFMACGFDAVLTKPISRASMHDMLTVLGLSS